MTASATPEYYTTLTDVTPDTAGGPVVRHEQHEDQPFQLLRFAASHERVVVRVIDDPDVIGDAKFNERFAG
jgi:hypothetical protein